IPMMWKLIFPPNTTHLNTVKDFTAFNVFPNPSSEKFHIAGCHLNDVITVYDISGKQKLEQVVQSSDHVELVNVSSLSAGFYILNVQRNGVNVFQKKLIYLGM
nr:T9SS type A sorting domain-containing protein [Bacteroidia bacterium]